MGVFKRAISKDFERMLHVAIIGAGPAGIYTAGELIKNFPENSLKVDIFEKLFCPFGLVRTGVAPDHTGIKKVALHLEKILENPAIQFLGNLEVGKSLSLKAIKENYNCVVFCNGTEKDRKLGLPGESLSNIFGAAEFVGWYNLHPEYLGLVVETEVEHAVVIGLGNVALDVARILLKDPKELEQTRISKQGSRETF